jgi:secreted trypsin-like serine protease
MRGGSVLARVVTVLRSRVLAAFTFAIAAEVLLVSTDAFAIVSGKADETASIVSIGPAAEPLCSATLIGPRLVVTAAHCMTRGDLPVNVDGKPVAVAFVKVHPEFDQESLDHDIALVVLADDVTVTPMAFSTAVPSAGSRVRFVGWGRTAQNGESKGRRAGFVKVDKVDAMQFKTVPDPSTACGRDSGGAVLDEDGTTLVGIISNGDAKCESYAFATRLDVNQGFIEETLSGMENSGCRASGSPTSSVPGSFGVLAGLVAAAKRRLFQRARGRAESIGHSS